MPAVSAPEWSLARRNVAGRQQSRFCWGRVREWMGRRQPNYLEFVDSDLEVAVVYWRRAAFKGDVCSNAWICLLYTSDAADDMQ
eukprot:925415-Alexandrium_andersonii.AAC.1